MEVRSEDGIPGVEVDYVRPAAVTATRFLEDAEDQDEDEELARPLSVTEVLGPRKKRIRVIRDPREACATIQDGEAVAWDLETGGLNPWSAPIAVVSLYGERSQVPCVLHIRGTMPPELRQLLRSPRLWVGHNQTCFDRLFLHQAGINTYGTGVKHYDTLIGESVTKTSGRHNVRVNLQATLARRIGKKVPKDADHHSWMNDELDAKQVAYCVDDVQFGHRLRAAQVKETTEEGRYGALEFEQDLAQVVTSMILTGLPLDYAALHEWHQHSRTAIARAEAHIVGLCGNGFNPGSPLQVKNAIQQHFGLDLGTTRAEVLETYSEVDSPMGRFCRDLLLWRKGTKRTGMYDQQWLDQFVQYDNRIHGRFWQVGAETGRFTGSDPNMQQWPRDGRGVIGGEEGMQVISADYSSIEVMVAAGLANDRALLEDCLGDPHLNLAKFMLGGREASEERVREVRRIAKAGNFTILFGGGVKRFHEACVAGGSKITLGEARAFVDQYLKRYQGINRMRERAFRMADSGVVKLVFPTGLRRVMVGPEVTPTRILNNVVQGTAAAGIKYAMLEMYNRGMVHGYLGSTVHDELVSCVPLDEADEYAEQMRDAMVVGMGRAIRGIPVRVDVKRGTHWS